MAAERPYTRNPLLEGFVEGDFETSDGVTLRYLRAGDGTPLVMVPGWSATADAYSLNAPFLAQGNAVFVLEMRGHGFSEAPDHGARIARLAADLAEFVAWLGAPETNLLGWSMGASVIWSYLELFGTQGIGRAVFVDQSPCLLADPSDSDEEARAYAGNRIDVWDAHRRLSEDFDASRGEVFREYFSYGVQGFPEEELRAAPDDYFELWQRVPRNPPKAGPFLTELLRDHVNQDWRDLFPTFDLPVLLLTGDLSHATTPEAGQWMCREMPDCTWVRFSAEELGDHNFMQRAYRRFNACVEAFLAGEEVPGAEDPDAELACAEPANDYEPGQGYAGDLFDIARVEVGPRSLVAHVRLAPGAPSRTEQDPEATNRVLALFPHVTEHACTGDAGPAFGDAVASTELAHLLEHVTLELLAQTELAGDVSSGRTRAEASDPRGYEIELACPDDVLVAACLSSAAWVMDWAYSGGDDPAPDVEGIVAGLVALMGSLDGGSPDGEDAPDGDATIAAQPLDGADAPDGRN